jgi:uncharacterized protein YeaO (DUF488 family)
MIQLERVYDSLQSAKGAAPRFLVERLWPRGVKKAALQMDGWLREVAPSTELRQWFNHEPSRWAEFKRRYHAELAAHPEAWAPLLAAASEGDVTLLFSSRDTEHNNALALKAFLERKLTGKRPAAHRAAPSSRG